MRRDCSLGKAAVTTSADDAARVTGPGQEGPLRSAAMVWPVLVRSSDDIDAGASATGCLKWTKAAV